MKLIVNGDDFGFSKEVNKDIIKCHTDGILTSATIIAYGDAFDDAIDMAKKYPKLGIGVHLVIDGDFDIPKRKSSLIDVSRGTFYGVDEALKKIKNGSFKYQDLVEEYSCQIEKVLRSGVEITHLDHHHHLHLYFPVLNAVIEVAKRYNIPYIRPQKIVSSYDVSLSKKVYREFHHFYLKNRYKTIDGYLGLLSFDQEVMRERLQTVLRSDREVVELMVHPSLENGEVAFLTDQRVVDLSEDNLINYGTLLSD